MTAIHSDWVPLPQLLHQLKEHCSSLLIDPEALASLKFRFVYGLVLDGKLPAEKVGAGWKVRRSDLPTVAATLGLTPAGCRMTKHHRSQSSNESAVA